MKYILKYCNFVYKNFELGYTLEKQNNYFIAKPETEYWLEKPINNIFFKNNTKNKVINELKNWFKDIVDNNKILSYIKDGYRLFLRFDSCFYSKEHLIGYHITDLNNKNNILQNGLTPNYIKDDSVYIASNIADKVKEEKYKDIPNYISKTNSIYLHPDLYNGVIVEQHYTNQALFAVNYKNYLDKCWIGSMGISGFMLYEEGYSTEKGTKLNSNLYWRNSTSIYEYLNNTYNFKKKDNYWGLDEILVSSNINKEDIEYIGYWDENGDFVENEKFKNYILNKNYKDILNFYQVSHELYKKEMEK